MTLPSDSSYSMVLKLSAYFLHHSLTNPPLSFPCSDPITASQSMQWLGGHDQNRDDLMRHYPSLSKPHPSRSRHRGPEPLTADSTTQLRESVIFSESPLVPGVPVVFRTAEERVSNPDRLNLDRRHLLICPILEGEDRLRLLNLQHNSITILQNLSGLRRLVFLDLYDNLVHEISGLEGLLSLRVLMLGRNRWVVGGWFMCQRTFIYHSIGLERFQVCRLS